MRMLSLIMLAAAAATACTPKPPPPDAAPPDSFDQTPADAGVAEDIAEGTAEAATPVGRACRNLAALKCIEGLKRDAGDTCAQAIHHVLDTHLTKFDVDCVINAKTPAAVRACAGASCTVAK